MTHHALQRFARRGALFLGLVLTLPLCGAEGVYLWALGKVDTLPAPVSEPALPVDLERAIWVSTGETLPLSVRPIRSWHVVWTCGWLMLNKRTADLPGERAAGEAARLSLTLQSQTNALDWHLRSWALTVWLTRHWEPEQLTRFIGQNSALGREATGVFAASRAYFGKEASTLTPSETALLMALKVSSRSFSPDCHPERALKKRHRVLTRLLEEGAITREAFERADSTPLEFIPDPSAPCP